MVAVALPIDLIVVEPARAGEDALVVDGERLPVRKAPPTLGEGTQEVLQSLLGVSDARLAELKAKGVT